MSLADDIRRMIRKEIQIDTMDVLELSDDPSQVTLDDGSGLPLNDIPCFASYDDRAPGDTVYVVKLGNSYAVIGAVKAPTEEGPTETQIRNWIQQAINDADIPSEVGVSWGKADPAGGGWSRMESVWMKDDGDGNRSIYGKLPTVDPDPPPPTERPPKPPTTPDPKTITPTDRHSYRTNGQTNSGLIYGPATPWGSSARWTSAIFYGEKIQDACQGHSVAKMEITMARRGSLGWNRKIPLRIGLHDRKTEGKITQVDSAYVLARIAWNGKVTVPLKASFRDALASGAAWGVGFTTSTSGDYMGLTSTSGHIKITFD